MINSSEMNKVLRAELLPVMREIGFSKVEPRKCIGWHDECIWLFKINAVGSYFSQVTGWPPASVCVRLGVFCKYLPSKKIDVNNEGLPVPTLEECHYSVDLRCSLNQSHFTVLLKNDAEQKRNDIWWIQPDGSNIKEVVCGLKEAMLSFGIKWLSKYNDKEKVLKEIEERKKLDFEIENYFAKDYGK